VDPDPHRLRRPLRACLLWRRPVARAGRRRRTAVSRQRPGSRLLGLLLFLAGARDDLSGLRRADNRQTYAAPGVRARRPVVLLPQRDPRVDHQSPGERVPVGARTEEPCVAAECEEPDLLRLWGPLENGENTTGFQ